MSLILQLQAAQQCRDETINAMCDENGMPFSFLGYDEDLMLAVYGPSFNVEDLL